MRRALPPVAAVKAAAVLAVPVVGGAGLAGVVGGPLASLGVVIGVIGGLAPAVTTLPWRARAVLASTIPAVAALGVAAGGHAWWAGLLVAAACGLQWPVGPRAGGTLAFLPVLGALTASIGLSDPVRVAAWVAAGTLLIVAVAALLRIQVAPVLVPKTLARRHAVVSALATGLAMVICVRSEVTHGYWLVMTLAVVLRPVAGETSSGARDRTLGTLAGTGLGIAAATLLPLWLVVVFMIACFVLALAWAVAKDVLRQTMFTTPIVVLAGSSGVSGSPVTVATERVVLTVAAALIAVALAALLHLGDARVRPSAEASG